MNQPMKRLLIWTPRILCILFAIFVSIFALDVLDEGRGFWTTLLALLIHLIPTAIVIVVLAMSWRWEWVGGAIYSLLGILYIVMFRGRFLWWVYVMMSGPMFIAGILFFINWRFRRDLRAGS
jgi:hypothetical protein